MRTRDKRDGGTGRSSELVGQNIKEKNESKPGVLLGASTGRNHGPSTHKSWSVSFSSAKLSSDHPVMGKRREPKKDCEMD